MAEGQGSLRNGERGRLWPLPYLIAAVHLALAIGYAWVTPYRQGGYNLYARDPETGGPKFERDIGAPDERQHVNYVARIAHGKGFPVLDPKDPALYENYQAHQPPLFYVLAAGWSKIVGITTFETRDEGFLLRLLNALLGAISVLGVFHFAFAAMRNAAIAAASATFAALLPMNLAVSGAVSNDPLLIALCSWTLAVAARGIRDGWTIRLAVGTGILCGLALLTKTTAIALIPALLLGQLLAGAKSGALSLKPLFVAVSIAILFAIPWWIRNQVLYGDPLAVKAFNDAFIGSPKAIEFIRMTGVFGYWTGASSLGVGVLNWTMRSFLGMFGYMNVFLPMPLYTAFYVLLGILTIGRLAAFRRPEMAESHGPRLLGTIFFLLILAFYLRFNSEYFQAQARYLFPALAPISLFLGIGLCALGGKRPWLAIGAYIVAFVALNAWIVGWLPEEFAKRTG
jgi:4-amino-4-deoxy-L-arabinose transferase-like glycosyltransferase